MKRLAYKKIDAFVGGNSEGNPAGYIALKSLDDLTAEEMQLVAKRQKGFVNEVGFVAQTDADKFDLKFYSSEREVDFCGHATIAIMYNLLDADVSLQKFKRLLINTNRGLLEVENHIASEDAVFIMSPIPFTSDNIPSIEIIADNLKISPESIDPSLPISIVNAGLTTLIVPIASLKSILGICPNVKELNKFCVSSGIDIIEVFCKETTDPKNDYRTRVFAPRFGYLEDPATGSGNSAFGYYMINNKMWDQERSIVLEQNGLKDQFNIVRLKKSLDENNIQRVWFGGNSVTRIEGIFFL